MQSYGCHIFFGKKYGQMLLLSGILIVFVFATTCLFRRRGGGNVFVTKYEQSFSIVHLSQIWTEDLIYELTILNMDRWQPYRQSRWIPRCISQWVWLKCGMKPTYKIRAWLNMRRGADVRINFY